MLELNHQGGRQVNLSADRVTRWLLCVLALMIVGSAGGATLYVAPSANCGGQAPCYSTIQAAVDAAVGADTVKVAAGTYAGTSLFVIGIIVYDQVVMIKHKSLTLQGGYTPSNWVTPDPTANLTTIDAQGYGRCVTIVGTGTQSVAVAGFTMTGGDYDNLGNPAGFESEECFGMEVDCGGGLFARSVTLHLRDSVVTGNTASTSREGRGGGAYLWGTLAGTTIENTVFSSNDASFDSGSGGGVYIFTGEDVTVSGCTFSGNQADVKGGGLRIERPSGKITVEDTSFTDNSANSALVEGAGAIDALLAFAGTALELNRVTMTSNHGKYSAAAVYLNHHYSNDVVVEMTNVIFADNTYSSPASSIDISDPVVNLVASFAGSLTVSAHQLTFAGHSGMSAVRVSAPFGAPGSANLSNVLIDTAEYAFVADESLLSDVIVEHTNTMTNNVSQLHRAEDRGAVLIANNPLTGLPHFGPGWRLQAESEAIDAGVDSGVTDDIDGEPRPIGSGFDIGADEYDDIFVDGFESGSTNRWSSTVP